MNYHCKTVSNDEDAKKLASFLFEHFKEILELMPYKVEPTRENFSDWFYSCVKPEIQDNGAIFICLKNSEVVGVLIGDTSINRVFRNKVKHLNFDILYVAPNSRKIVGGLLCIALEKWCEKNGIETISIQTRNPMVEKMVEKYEKTLEGSVFVITRYRQRK